AEGGQHALQHGQQAADAARLDHEVPERLEFLPASRIGQMAQPAGERVLGPGAAGDRPPPVEVPIRAPVAIFERLGGHAARAKDDMARIVKVPLAVQDPALGLHPLEERGSWYGVRMWKVAVSTPLPIAHSTVRSKTESS